MSECRSFVARGDDLVLVGGARTLRERFEAAIIRDADPSGCWLWVGARRVDGYGQITLTKGVNWRAHRVAYLLENGALPKGLVLDHLCRNRGCVNPFHLEAVTHEENIARGVEARLGPTCQRGHARTTKNTYRKGDHHECRVCHRDRERKRKARLRA